MDTELLAQIKLLLQNNKREKRWLNVKEAAFYLGYSVDGLRKLLNFHLFLDVHYYKKSGKLIFDSYALDEWVMEDKIA